MIDCGIRLVVTIVVVVVGGHAAIHITLRFCLLGRWCVVGGSRNSIGSVRTGCGGRTSVTARRK